MSHIICKTKGLESSKKKMQGEFLTSVALKFNWWQWSDITLFHLVDAYIVNCYGNPTNNVTLYDFIQEKTEAQMA